MRTAAFRQQLRPHLPRAAKWLVCLRVARFSAVGSCCGERSLATAPPLVWLARALT